MMAILTVVAGKRMYIITGDAGALEEVHTPYAIPM